MALILYARELILVQPVEIGQDASRGGRRTTAAPNLVAGEELIGDHARTDLGAATHTDRDLGRSHHVQQGGTLRTRLSEGAIDHIDGRVQQRARVRQCGRRGQIRTSRRRR